MDGGYFKKKKEEKRKREKENRTILLFLNLPADQVSMRSVIIFITPLFREAKKCNQPR